MPGRSPELPLHVWILDPANLTPFYSLALGSALVSHGASVRFVTSRFSYDPDLEIPPEIDVQLHYFPGADRWDRFGATSRKIYRALRYPLDHRRLVRLIDRGEWKQPDVVHLQWSRLPMFDRSLVAKLKKKGIKVVHTVHDVEPLYEGAADMSGLGRVYQNCDALIVHTEANRRDLLERYPAIDVRKVHVVPHGPLQADACPADGDRAKARAALGISADARVALNFGSIKPYKGLDLFVSAMPMVVQNVPQAFLLLAGRPARPADAPDMTILQSRGIGHRADLEFISNKDTWKYYMAADVVVLPYLNITQSGVLLSSMAFGKPAIVTAVGGLPEVIRPGQTGWVVPPENVPALAEAISDALSDPDRCDRMGLAARQDVLERFSWQAIGRETVRIYQSV
ncbi:glycosyltransferase family 4 protein [bacterium]|nr:glycosyltransferase family 4 protein [bacterium]